jgi:hypothetical protein
MDFFKHCFRAQEPSIYNDAQILLAKMVRFRPDMLNQKWRRAIFASPNGSELNGGVFRFDSVSELRKVAKNLLISMKYNHYKWTKDHVSGDSRELHSQIENGMFQGASQFNALEFVSPRVTPEAGITCYMDDRTQGPACAIACAANTAFRNYLVPVEDGKFAESSLPYHFDAPPGERFGQHHNNQLNGLVDVERIIFPLFDNKKLWEVKNGYIELTPDGINLLPCLNKIFEEDFDLCRKVIDAVRVASVFDTAVTDMYGEGTPSPFLVSQCFASACSIGYSRYRSNLDAWEPLARIALYGAYEATFYTYIIHACRCVSTNRNAGPMLLTKLGGGVFSNPTRWICDAMKHAEMHAELLFDDVAQQVGKTGQTFDFPVQLTHFRETEPGYESYMEMIPVKNPKVKAVAEAVAKAAEAEVKAAAKAVKAEVEVKAAVKAVEAEAEKASAVNEQHNDPMCCYFLQGRCQYGPQHCKFSHWFPPNGSCFCQYGTSCTLGHAAQVVTFNQ